MMLLQSIGFVLAVAATAQSAIIPRSHVLHEKRDSISPKWVKREKVGSSDILPMRIGLKQRNLDRGHDILMDISHPDSPNFGQHLTPQEIIELFAPPQTSVNAIKQWLIEAGISQNRLTHTDNQGWIAFDATTDEAEGLFHTEYHFYEHIESGQMAPACEKYHVPSHVQEHLDYVTPGIRLLSAGSRSRSKRDIAIEPRARSHRIISTPAPAEWAAGGLTGCDQLLTPDCIRALYGIPEEPEYPNGVPRSDNSLGIFEDGDIYLQQDLDFAFANFTPKIPQGTSPTPAFIDGGQAPTDQIHEIILGMGESALDFQLAYPLIYPQNITLFQTDDAFYSNSAIGSFNTFLDAIDGSYCTYSAFGETGDDPALDPVYPDPRPNGYHGKLQCGVYKPTNVISVSYGVSESDYPAYYQQRMCNEFMKLGLQGVSILFASGDEGVGGRPHPPLYFDNGCIGLDGSDGPDYKIFTPNFPNTYITNVGATQILPGHTVLDEEVAADPNPGYSSGGGFSNLFSVPHYQAAAVNSFFDNHNPPYAFYEGADSLGANGGVYNRSGRGYPDVSANGWLIATFIGGYLHQMAGTSASTPIFASLINRINELRLNAGKSTLGFLNPAFYGAENSIYSTNGSIFHDITNGTNPGCDTVGFSAVQGWDPVTGLGTPNYPKMRDYLLALP